MLAKLTSKNQLTLPKFAIATIGSVEYFEIEARNGQLILTPVRIQRAGAVRAKLAELALTNADIDTAVTWARQHVAETPAAYPAKARQRRKRKT